MPAVYKNLKTQVEASDDSRMSLTFTITSGAVDREGEIVDPRGGVFDAYSLNPVMMFAHDYSQIPIARTLDLWGAENKRTGGASVKARVEFQPDYNYQPNWKGLTGRMVYRMYKTGFLNSVSIGFNPLASEPLELKGEYGLGGRKRGRRYTRWELLEFSAVPVPANPEALVDRTETAAVKKALGVWARDTIAYCEKCERDHEVIEYDLNDLSDDDFLDLMIEALDRIEHQKE